jgi:hypothetical protein
LGFLNLSLPAKSFFFVVAPSFCRLFLYHNSNKLANYNHNDFKMLSIIEETAVISAVGAIALAIFAVIQLRHMEKHRNVDVSMKLFEWAENERLRKAMRWVSRDFQFKTYEEYKAFEQSNLEASEYPFEVVAFFEQIGFLIEKKYVDFDVVRDRLGQSIVLNWQKLEPWILAVRKEKNDAGFGEHYQHLFERMVKTFKKP